jgi:hypothetical protein
MWFAEVCWAFADVLKYRAVCSNERDMATAEVAFRDMASLELAFKIHKCRRPITGERFLVLRQQYM